MAGFGTILGDPFFDAYEGRVLNAHLSAAIVPRMRRYERLTTRRRNYGLPFTYTLEVDAGPILAQAAVKYEMTTRSVLHERIKLVSETHNDPFLADWNNEWSTHLCIRRNRNHRHSEVVV